MLDSIDSRVLPGRSNDLRGADPPTTRLGERRLRVARLWPILTAAVSGHAVHIGEARGQENSNPSPRTDPGARGPSGHAS